MRNIRKTRRDGLKVKKYLQLHAWVWVWQNTHISEKDTTFKVTKLLLWGSSLSFLGIERLFSLPIKFPVARFHAMLDIRIMEFMQIIKEMVQGHSKIKEPSLVIHYLFLPFVWKQVWGMAKIRSWKEIHKRVFCQILTELTNTIQRYFNIFL